jgi:hypothetical protein
MKQLIDNLRSFNSKERFFLIGHALGNRNFAVSQTFKNDVANVLQVEIPSESFVAMDYHLEWIYASLYLTFNGENSQIFPNTDGLIKGNQEDIDLVIAFLEDASCHIILIEAKGVTGWTNKQANSKAIRLRKIFGSDGRRWPGVNPHFLLFSPKRPKRLDISGWPTWMTVNDQVPWLEFPIPSGLRKVTSCNSTGQKDRNGQFWQANFRAVPLFEDSIVMKLTDHTKAAGHNYREKLSLTDIITKCQTDGDNIVVGYQGGASQLRKDDPMYIKERLYKWDLFEDSVGHKIQRNWINGSEFIEIVRDKLTDLVRQQCHRS